MDTPQRQLEYLEYRWFTDWGRDTMISLEGLTLTTGRHDEAGYILRTFADYVCNGLMPTCSRRGNRRIYIIQPMPLCGSFMPWIAISTYG
jgi:glycogen debranching enzyme